MPHFESGHVVQHVTFRLADSLPADVLRRLEEEAQSLAPEQRAAGLHRRLEAWVDAGHGCCVLRRPEAAELVQAALLHFDAERYRLLAWAIMPNHVHVLLQTCGDWTLAATVKSWKSFTGRRLVPLLPAGGTRQVWYREYWDRYIRDARHLAAAEAYIHQNPVRAGLVGSAEEWEWGSAKLELGAPSVARLVPGGHTQAKET
jgi:REP element-mobilizing transposase RayT